MPHMVTPPGPPGRRGCRGRGAAERGGRCIPQSYEELQAMNDELRVGTDELRSETESASFRADLLSTVLLASPRRRRPGRFRPARGDGPAAGLTTARKRYRSRFSGRFSWTISSASSQSFTFLRLERATRRAKASSGV